MNHNDNKENEMESMLSQLSKERFKPGFADRVLIRLREEKERDFILDLQWAFRRFALAGITTIVLLAINNLVNAGELSLDGVMGIQKPGLEETLSLDEWIGGE